MMNLIGMDELEIQIYYYFNQSVINKEFIIAAAKARLKWLKKRLKENGYEVNDESIS